MKTALEKLEEVLTDIGVEYEVDRDTEELFVLYLNRDRRVFFEFYANGDLASTP